MDAVIKKLMPNMPNVEKRAVNRPSEAEVEAASNLDQEDRAATGSAACPRDDLLREKGRRQAQGAQGGGTQAHHPFCPHGFRSALECGRSFYLSKSPLERSRVRYDFRMGAERLADQRSGGYGKAKAGPERQRPAVDGYLVGGIGRHPQ